MSKYFLAVLVISCMVFQAMGQEPDTESMVLDTVYNLGNEVIFHADTLLIELDLTHSPMKATLYALVLPGLGQAYNKKYWKMPIVWAGLGGVAYAINFNTKKYNEAKNEYINEPIKNNENALKYWRRYVELSYIGLIVVYALQVLDAYVDAQLFSWNVNDNLGMGVHPSLQPMMHPSSLTGQAVGITCSLKIRGR